MNFTLLKWRSRGQIRSGYFVLPDADKRGLYDDLLETPVRVDGDL